MPVTRVMMFGWPFGLLALSLTALVPLGWYLGSPLFVDRSVGEVPPVLELGGIANMGSRLVAQGSFGVVDASHLLKGKLGDQSDILPADLNLEDFKSGDDLLRPLRRGFIHSNARLRPEGNNP